MSYNTTTEVVLREGCVVLWLIIFCSCSLTELQSFVVKCFKTTLLNSNSLWHLYRPLSKCTEQLHRDYEDHGKENRTRKQNFSPEFKKSINKVACVLMAAGLAVVRVKIVQGS